MLKQELKSAGVTFASGPHTYTRDSDGKQLQGVTAMIHKLLYPDEFDGIDPAVLSAKAAYGTRCHREIQDMIVFGDEPQTDAQKAFAALMQGAGLEPIASEYIVTDGKDFASCIDVLCSDCSIVDIKTVASLNRAKVSWQLSLYAMFFELTNPGVTAGKLYAAWIPKNGAPRLVEIPRKPEAELRALMAAWIGGTDYKYESKISRTNIEMAASVKLQIEQLTEQYNRLAAAILAEMKEKGETSFSDDFCTVSFKAASTRRSFDSKSFQTADPATYAMYLRESATPETICMRLK